MSYGNTVENDAATQTYSDKNIEGNAPSKKSKRKRIRFLYQESCIMLLVQISQQMK